MSEIRSHTTAGDDVLFEDFRSVDLPNTYYHQDDGCGTPAIRPSTAEEAAMNAMDVVKAAGWTPPPRTVSSATELDSLPVGSVVREVDDSVSVFEKVAYEERETGWEMPGDLHWYMPAEITLPVIVLFTPGDANVDGTTSVSDWLSDERLREQRLRPMSEVMGEVLKDADLTFELKPPTPLIPYDEMRRLCGLPDVRGYVARREFVRMGKQLGGVFQRAAEAWTEGVNKALPGLQAFVESAQPNQSPPMWAVDPAHSRRTRNRAVDIRTPYR